MNEIIKECVAVVNDQYDLNKQKKKAIVSAYKKYTESLYSASAVTPGECLKDSAIVGGFSAFASYNLSQILFDASASSSATAAVVCGALGAGATIVSHIAKKYSLKKQYLILSIMEQVAENEEDEESDNNTSERDLMFN